ncbi:MULTISPECIES: MDR family MFS transporter [Microbacterium]|uniref:DHA2 family efflux MFS transporter permease subunit n=1 Tax=Microbacterium galbinum TaxID=2851646 RepID=A0ABY4ISZ7_9MICO|nr:MDR family MFS transporter [Microbacterium galbinum]MBQ3357940.1 multidrug efflux MFS transporter [Microbacterium sp.]MCK2022292.1 DHA2 family efflux MFS transporter permease subunit [Microbacterium galbinum]UPL15132.1 DHA2 family efflux MFS transporter permease subunit [Microbacterium galbinum]
MSAVDTGSIPTTAPADGTIARSDMRVIWLLLVAAFVAILNETTMGIAIPHLNTDLGIPPELGQWLTSAFMLTMAVVIPTTGFILQRFTTRQVFIAAMISFSLGTLVSLIAPGFAVLLVGRVIQAVGTGIMMPLLMTTIMNVVPPQSRGRMMGRVGMVISLAPATGPVLAGAVLEVFNWRALFAIILPIALIALAMGIRWMTNLGETRRMPLDVVSIPLAALGFGGIVFGISQLGGEGAGAGATTGVIALVVGVVSLGLFVWRQLVLQRVDDALLDLRVFRSTNFTFSVIIMSILALSMFGTLTLLPQYLQNVVGLESFSAGLILLPGSVLMGLLGPIMGRVYDARGTRPLLIPGTILVSAALFFYSTVSEHTEWWVLVIVQAVMSVGLAMSFTPLFSASLGSLQRSLYSHGSAVLNTMQQVAGAAGVAVLLVTYSAILHSGEEQGLSTALAGAPGARMAFLIAAIISLAAVALSPFVRKPADDAGGEFHGGH